MKDFWNGFGGALEKRAIAPWVPAGIASVISGAKTRLGKVLPALADRLGGATSAAKSVVSAPGTSPQFNIMRRAALATTGAAGIAYGGNRLAHHDVQQMSGQNHHPGLRQGPAM